MEFNTLLLRGKEVNRYAFGGTQPCISQSSTYAYQSAEDLEKVFNNRLPGFAYTRVSNPTVDAFERRVNELEGGLAALACSSGMAAVSTTLLNLLCSGDEIISSNALFGGTLEFFRELEKFGITTHLVDRMDVDSVAPLINDKTRVIFTEIVFNTSLDVVDVKALAELAHSHAIPLVVDATTVTPFILRPFTLGADIVVHSSSKYITGSGNAISGIIVDSGRFNWDFERFKALADYRKFQRYAFIARLRSSLWRNLGGCLSPFNAYLNVVGLETLGLRMERICHNAQALAQALEGADGLKVTYPGLSSSPYYELVQRQFNGLGGGIINLRAGSRERAFALMNKLKYASLATNIGDLRTLVIYPLTTIYQHIDPKSCARVGVYDDTLRISVGIEDERDLIADFSQAAAFEN